LVAEFTSGKFPGKGLVTVPAPPNGTGKNGLSGPVGAGNRRVTESPSRATTGGVAGILRSGPGAGCGGAGGAVGNRIPSTVMKPWPLFSGCTVNELWTAVTLPPTPTLLHWSPMSPNPPSLNCAPMSRPLLVAEFV
jgi:hypothetical protein